MLFPSFDLIFLWQCDFLIPAPAQLLLYYNYLSSVVTSTFWVIGAIQHLFS